MKSIVIAAARAQRRIDLDWVRIIAFALLIFYHVASFYASVTPHNQALSPRTFGWLAVPMLALSPWRLLILFIVSGAATRFMADKMEPRMLFRARNHRLSLPLWFVVTVIVPPIAFVTVRQWSGYPGDFVSYLSHYFTFDRICKAAGCPPVPNYFHLWFVAYLWLYTLALVVLLTHAPELLRRLQRGLERALSGWGLIVWPVAYLALTHFALEGLFPQSYDVIHDWYAHAVYLGAFLLGFSLAKSDAIWAAFERNRVGTLIGALASYGALITLVVSGTGPEAGPEASTPARAILAALESSSVLGFDQWLWIAAAFGFARRYLSERNGVLRRYLTDAIFPFYIIHMLTIQVGGHYLTRFGLSIGMEFALLVSATVFSCFVTYEIVRRVAWLRPLFGLKGLHPPVQVRQLAPTSFYLREEG
jgi:glucan biosynthesis protein C